ncbi:Transcriptional regulatory protein LiaR [bioreactor metagenome]|uniref:Transcriptional regulatory protein LiaR n=1 Tax=bioreactor metagenome TaxID=1076179 RepID=A0A645GXV3_9ZZZZ
MAIISPLFLQNRLTYFSKMKRQYPEISWIGVVYSLFEDKILSMFDGIISITDSKERVSEIIKKALKKQCSCNNNQHDDLSEREIDVLVLLVDGCSNKEIADKLCISIHTVVTHRKNISEKTGIKSLSGLTIYAISKKIINPIF